MAINNLTSVNSQNVPATSNPNTPSSTTPSISIFANSKGKRVGCTASKISTPNQTRAKVTDTSGDDKGKVYIKTTNKDGSYSTACKDVTDKTITQYNYDKDGNPIDSKWKDAYGSYSYREGKATFSG